MTYQEIYNFDNQIEVFKDLATDWENLIGDELVRRSEIVSDRSPGDIDR
jgi:hypothetical protein